MHVLQKSATDFFNNQTLYKLAQILSPSAFCVFCAKHSYNTCCDIQKLSLGCHFHIHLPDEASKRKYCLTSIKRALKTPSYIKNIFVQAFELEIHIWHATEQITFGVFWDETQQLVQGIENRDASKCKQCNFEGQFIANQLNPFPYSWMKIVVRIPMTNTMNMSPEKPGYMHMYIHTDRHTLQQNPNSGR